MVPWCRRDIVRMLLGSTVVDLCIPKSGGSGRYSSPTTRNLQRTFANVVLATSPRWPAMPRWEKLDLFQDPTPRKQNEAQLLGEAWLVFLICALAAEHLHPVNEFLLGHLTESGCQPPIF